MTVSGMGENKCKFVHRGMRLDIDSWEVLVELMKIEMLGSKFRRGT